MVKLSRDRMKIYALSVEIQQHPEGAARNGTTRCISPRSAGGGCSIKDIVI
jgi:hypothetical protein